jgi:hypothetical protein
MTAIFLLQWLLSVEEDVPSNLTDEERKIVNLLNDLLLEADPEARDPRKSVRFLTIKAYQFDGVNVWGSMPSSLLS